jgi:hypothetical protein
MDGGHWGPEDNTILEFIKLLTGKIHARYLARPSRNLPHYGPIVDRHKSCALLTTKNVVPGEET